MALWGCHTLKSFTLEGDGGLLLFLGSLGPGAAEHRAAFPARALQRLQGGPILERRARQCVIAVHRYLSQHGVGSEGRLTLSCKQHRIASSPQCCTEGSSGFLSRAIAIMSVPPYFPSPARNVRGSSRGRVSSRHESLKRKDFLPQRPRCADHLLSHEPCKRGPRNYET